MPPRYAYWTILIDNQPTAFRAREHAELLPTLQQLKRTNPNATMKWFARGKLWDTPEQAQWAGKNLPKPHERRDREWRPGGQHKDPRARFKPDRTKKKTAARPAPGPRAAAQPPPRAAHPPPRTATQPPRSAAPRKPWPSRKPGPRTAKPWQPARKPWQQERKPWQKDARAQGSRDARPPRRKDARGNTQRPPHDRPERKPWQHEPGPEHPRRRTESPDQPPMPEQIVTKPKPPERG